MLTLGLKFADWLIVGGNQRTTALLKALCQVIMDYQSADMLTSADLSRNLDARLKPLISFIVACRPLSIGMGNAIRSCSSLCRSFICRSIVCRSFVCLARCRSLACLSLCLLLRAPGVRLCPLLLALRPSFPRPSSPPRFLPRALWRKWTPSPVTDGAARWHA